MKKKYKIIPLLFVLLFPLLGHAKDSAIVIFDGSGSMKKKINGKPKFEVARKVMRNLVKEWHEDIDLGLMVYGHRSKACDDIEMLIPVGALDGDKFLAAIKKIKPKGETPIAESLKRAAEKLNYVESPTTVILISDGEESCNADPCAMAKKLEADSGTKFTAHVVGFDVSGAKQVKALEQLKCVAKSTGGMFIEAKDSAGLKAALVETAKVIAEPKIEAILTAVDSSTNEAINGEAEWTLINVATEAIHTLKSDSASLKAKLVKGKYEVFIRIGDQSGEGKITISAETDQKFTIKMSKNSGSNKPFDATSTVMAGEPMSFNWKGPNTKGDLIFIMKKGAPDNRYYYSSRQSHKVEDGMPATLIAPAEVGDYEIRYYSYGNGTVLSRMPLTVKKGQVTIEAPVEIPAGKVFSVSWTGPNAPDDRLFIAKKSLKDSKYTRADQQYFLTKEGSSGKLIAPAKLGNDYEIRYYSYNNGAVLARAPLKIIAAIVTFDAPRIVSVGTVLEVKWTGPDAPDDMLFIAKPDMDEGRYYNSDRQRALTSEGSPAKLTVPAKAGTYEIRYYSRNNGKVLARRALIVR